MRRPADGRRKHSMIIGALLALAVVALALIWFGQRSLIYFPDRTPLPSAAAVLPGAQDVALTTTDGLTLGAWYLPPAAPCRAAVLVAPGNGGNRAGRTGLARALHRQGFGVLLLDYRGYGANPGRPSERGLGRDADAARAFLVERADVADDQLIYFGESLGSGVVTGLARRHPPAALVLRSPMTSLADVARSLYRVPVGPLLRDRFPVRAGVAHVRAPLAVVHGSADTLVPPSLSRAVAQAARDAGTHVTEIVVPDAEHNDAALAEGEAVVRAVRDVAHEAGITGCA